MKGNRITLGDIAKRVGVTKMTVSRYITTPEKVAKSTGQKIQAVIDEFGFIPNRAPVLLAQANTKTIGLTVSSFSNLLFSDLIDGAAHVLSGRRHDLNRLGPHAPHLKEP